MSLKVGMDCGFKRNVLLDGLLLLPQLAVVN